MAYIFYLSNYVMSINQKKRAEKAHAKYNFGKNCFIYFVIKIYIIVETLKFLFFFALSLRIHEQILT